ncbi:MAG: twin-arginine translocase subunit TatC [Candidatus Dormibacteria bacterium]
MAQAVVNADERRMSVVEHLADLRRVLMIAGGAWVATTILAFFFNGRILDFLLQPLKAVLPKANHLLTGAVYFGPTEGLTVPLKVSAVAGFILALPIILWQVWEFVSPGLRPVERRFAGPFILSALALFGAGASFAYFVMPIGLNFLATFLSGNATYFPDSNEYLSFFMMLIVIFGVTFELPVVLVLLGALGVVSSAWLRQRRKAAWVVIIFAALVVTPGADPFTPTALFLPLIVFFEAGILILDKVFHK